MQLTLTVNSSNKSLGREAATNLKNLINHYNIPETETIQHEIPLPPNAAGAGLLDSILTIIVGQGVIGKLLDVIRIWIETYSKRLDRNKSTVELEFQGKDGKPVKIVLQNINDVEKTAKAIMALIENVTI